MCLLAAVLLASAVPRSRPALAQPPIATEYDVKAAFLYNFAKFIEWPAAAFPPNGGAFVFGVVGEDPFGGSLERIARQQPVQGRPIAIRRAGTVGELGVCHVVFLAPGRSPITPEIIRSASRPHRLVVGDTPGLAEQGAGIGFFMEGRRVRFVVNLTATERAGLKVSSKLLKIARIIRP